MCRHSSPLKEMSLSVAACRVGHARLGQEEEGETPEVAAKAGSANRGRIRRTSSSSSFSASKFISYTVTHTLVASKMTATAAVRVCSVYVRHYRRKRGREEEEKLNSASAKG